MRTDTINAPLKAGYDKLALEKIQNGVCPICDKHGFVFTMRHIYLVHHLLAEDVRKEYGLNDGTPLCTKEHSEVFANRPQCHSPKTLTMLRDNGHKKGSRQISKEQHRTNRMAWLYSKEHISLAKVYLNTPEAMAKKKHRAQNRSPEVVKAQTDRILKAHANYLIRGK
jgi:hypothetical protein